MRRILLLALVCVGCSGGGNSPPPRVFEFEGDFWGASYCSPSNAGNAHWTITEEGQVVGSVFVACDNSTRQISGTISETGQFTGSLSNPVSSATGAFTLDNRNFTGHLTVLGHPHGFDLALTRQPNRPLAR